MMKNTVKYTWKFWIKVSVRYDVSKTFAVNLPGYFSECKNRYRIEKHKLLVK